MSEEAVGSTEGAARAAAPSEPSGSGLDLINLTKEFAGGVVAVDDVNLHVDHGEYVVLLGPSGCGKTTTLRMIGGHEYPTGGDIVLDGQSLGGLPPHKRPTTTVFQHFALFPHRSVLDNVSFGLKMDKIPKDARRARAMEALEMVGLTELASRKPRALSGGQQQRVALGRAMVTAPQIMLMDEPLSNIDPPNRLKMRQEILSFHKEHHLTTLYVTHNLADGVALADRIAVMHAGRFEQADTVENLMRQPATEYVADFFKAEQFGHRFAAT